MAQRSLINKVTWEDKFERHYWVDNKAKQTYIKWQKRYNNKKFRRLMKGDTNEY